MRRRPTSITRLLAGLVTCMLSGGALLACGESGDEAGAAEIEGLQIEDGQDNDHVENPEYDADPPSGGPHHPTWLNCGFYEEPVPNRHAVHTLEHGAVWFAHDPDLPDEGVEQLRQLYESEPDRVVVSPYPGLDAPVVAVAWERRLEVDSADDPRLEEFLDTFINGAQAPEPSAGCEGGVGQPA